MLHLGFGFSSQLCKVVGLAVCDVVLTLLQSLLGLVPSFLGDLLLGFLAEAGISSNVGVAFLVE
jgi:hypothetical protein